MINRSDVLHIARLARLDLDESDVEPLRVELSGILSHVERISELDLTDVPPTAHAIAQSGGLRADEPGESLPRDTALDSAPESDGTGFSVPSASS